MLVENKTIAKSHVEVLDCKFQKSDCIKMEKTNFHILNWEKWNVGIPIKLVIQNNHELIISQNIRGACIPLSLSQRGNKIKLNSTQKSYKNPKPRPLVPDP